MFKRDVFPAPEAPKIAVTSPGLQQPVTLLKIVLYPELTLYVKLLKLIVTA